MVGSHSKDSSQSLCSSLRILQGWRAEGFSPLPIQLPFCAPAQKGAPFIFLAFGAFRSLSLIFPAFCLLSARASQCRYPGQWGPAPTTLGLLLLGLLLPGEAAQKPTPCQSCRELVDKFNQGMVDTAKKNFGGGNTAWEEKSLSKYEFSEVRLLEIMEGLCGSSDFECNRLVEEHEELLEAWWLRLKKEHPDLFEWFCVKMLKVCCSPGTYGPDCSACQGGSARPCSGNGQCNGDGTREGDGTCQCHPGYRGALCTDCMDSYFSLLRNETHSVCTACDESCRTCTGPTSRDCTQCEVGWTQEDGACVDVDECAAETPPCGPQQHCENIGGSFNCEECDPTCVGCTGKGPGQCKECIPGYTKESGQCADVDECALPGQACTRTGENCYNTPGSYVCVCPEGFEETENACVQVQPTGDEVAEESPAQPPVREDL